MTMMMFPVGAVLANAPHYEKNPGRLLAVFLIAVAPVVCVSYMCPDKDEVHSKSGFYEITAPKPKSLRRGEQIGICKKYVRLFEESQDSCVYCRPQLMKFCGINADEVLTNVRGW